MARFGSGGGVAKTTWYPTLVGGRVFQLFSISTLKMNGNSKVVIHGHNIEIIIH